MLGPCSVGLAQHGTASVSERPLATGRSLTLAVLCQGVSSPRTRQQVRPQARGFFPGGLAAEAADLFVISVQQYFRRLPAAEIGGTGPVGTIQQTLGVAGILKGIESGGRLGTKEPREPAAP